jgi:hypothetical protein
VPPGNFTKRRSGLAKRLTKGLTITYRGHALAARSASSSARTIATANSSSPTRKRTKSQTTRHAVERRCPVHEEDESQFVGLLQVEAA